MTRTKYALQTKSHYLAGLRRVFRFLWEHHGAPKLDRDIRRVITPRPRNVTITEDERAALLRAASPHLRLWILLCSDLAIRSGTAIKIGPENYDALRQVISFTTKMDEKLTLPLTAELIEALKACEMSDPTPFVLQLWWRTKYMRNRPAHATRRPSERLRVQFRQLCRSVGINRRITLHDLRRTTAVAMLQETGDVRDVQALLGHRSLGATIWYLDHDLRPVKRATLEALKRPHVVPIKEQTA